MLPCTFSSDKWPASGFGIWTPLAPCPAPGAFTSTGRDDVLISKSFANGRSAPIACRCFHSHAAPSIQWDSLLCQKECFSQNTPMDRGFRESKVTLSWEKPCSEAGCLPRGNATGFSADWHSTPNPRHRSPFVQSLGGLVNPGCVAPNASARGSKKARDRRPRACSANLLF
jgi:hypothetical protein